MSSPLLFVCTYNVCRSPYLEHAFAARHDAAHEVRFSVESRGAAASEGRAICEFSARALADAGHAVEDVLEYRSRALHADDIGAAGLVLTASVAERATVAQMAPQARSRTFTVREFTHLTAGALTDSEREVIQEHGHEGFLDAVALVASGRRGAVTEPEPRRRWSLRPAPVDVRPYDIVDVHGAGDRAHRALFPALESDVADVEERMHRLWSSLRSE